MACPDPLLLLLFNCTRISEYLPNYLYMKAECFSTQSYRLSLHTRRKQKTWLFIHLISTRWIFSRSSPHLPQRLRNQVTNSPWQKRKTTMFSQENNKISEEARRWLFFVRFHSYFPNRNSSNYYLNVLI